MNAKNIVKYFAHYYMLIEWPTKNRKNKNDPTTAYKDIVEKGGKLYVITEKGLQS